MELAAEGLLNREVARRIGLTKYTVKNYMRTIYHKSGFGNRVQLALWYVRYREKRKGRTIMKSNVVLALLALLLLIAAALGQCTSATPGTFATTQTIP